MIRADKDKYGKSESKTVAETDMLRWTKRPSRKLSHISSALETLAALGHL